jgi:MoxR-like ATPase
VSADPADAIYEYSDDIVLAVNVALAAGRPLLVRGDPGTGKSSLARAVAAALGWRYYAVTVSSRSTARDLEWTYDSVARLAHAQAGKEFVLPRSAYVAPGVLWWAFDPGSAARRGVPAAQIEQAIAQGQTLAVDPAICFSSEPEAPDRAVVLIDEIDKADPDVPNDLLLPLGSFQFTLDDLEEPVVAHSAPLVIITTNEERDLPKAFLRRCVVLALKQPTKARLRRIARLHFPAVKESQLRSLITAYRDVRMARASAGEVRPSVAEFLDAVAACLALSTTPARADWPELVTLLLAKPVMRTDEPDTEDETGTAPHSASGPP